MSFMNFCRLSDNFNIINPLNIYDLDIMSNMLNEIKYTFDSFYKSSLTFKKTIDNLSDLNRLESSYCTLNLSNIDLIYSVRSAIEPFENTIKENGIYFKFINNIDNTDQKFIACDKKKLQSILFNLIFNSVEYTNKGDEIIISIEERDNKICICIEDTGIGIFLDELPKTFDKFFQGTNSIFRTENNLGLGLFIVNKFVKILDGKIYAYSNAHKGTKIMIELPIFLVEKPFKKIVPL